MNSIANKPHFLFYDVFKALAILTMLSDHIGFYFFPHTEMYRVVGRVAAPIFFFLVGYSHSIKIDNKILAYGFLLQLVYFIITPEFQTINVLFTITILRFCNRYIKFLGYFSLIILFIIVGFTASSSMAYVEFGTIAILFSILGYYVREKRNIYFLYALGVSTVILHIFVQQSHFHFYTINLVTLIFFLGTLVILFIHFEKINYKFLDNNYIKLLSKYALIIYFVHKALFEISALLISHMNPPAPSEYLKDERLIEKDLLTPNIK